MLHEYNTGYKSTQIGMIWQIICTTRTYKSWINNSAGRRPTRDVVYGDDAGVVGVVMAPAVALEFQLATKNCQDIFGNQVYNWYLTRQLGRPISLPPPPPGSATAGTFIMILCNDQMLRANNYKI